MTLRAGIFENFLRIKYFSFLSTGEFCQTKTPFCAGEYNPCGNGARCLDHFSHYTCECPPGFSGVNCTVNIDDCVNHMCQVSGDKK